MTMSVKRPVLAGQKIVAPRPTTAANTQRYGQVMTSAFNSRDPLALARSRARDARNAATDEVNAGRAKAPTVSPEYVERAHSAKSTAVTYPCAVTARFVSPEGELIAEDTLTVSVASVVNASDRVVPAATVDVPISRFKLPRGHSLADPDQAHARFELTSDADKRCGSTAITVVPAPADPSPKPGTDYTVQATPVMVVDGVRFPARSPWEFSARVDSSDMGAVTTVLRGVMETQLRQSMPQVKIVSVAWSDDYATAELDLEHRPQPAGLVVPGNANTLPGGEVLGVFPAGYRPSGAGLSEADARRVSAVSRVLTEEIARASEPVRRRAGLEPLSAVAVDSRAVGDLVAVCEATAESKSTKPTSLHDRLMVTLGRSRCAELLYPRQRRRGDDSVKRLAGVFVRSAEKALAEGRKSALLSAPATGVTAGIVVYAVDDYSKDYELSVSVLMHR